jgi:hypothetical protein
MSVGTGGKMKYREALIYIAACLLVWLSCGEQINPRSPGLSDPTSRKQSPEDLDSASLEAMKAIGAIFRAVDSSLLINPAHDDSVTFPSFELIFDSL